MLSFALLVLGNTDDAEARRHRSHRRTSRTRVVIGTPRVRFGFGAGPWSIHYTPAPRAGYIWIAGAYITGVWHPGYWRPSAPAQPGMVWVPGYWRGDTYVEGYWRDEVRSDQVWVDGFYDDQGNYIEGRWVNRGDVRSYTNGPDSPPPANNDQLAIPAR